MKSDNLLSNRANEIPAPSRTYTYRRVSLKYCRIRSERIERRMKSELRRLERERLTICTMVGMYCSDHHEIRDETLCASCQEFMDYADRRLQKCPYGEDKPTCANCPIHCYKASRKAQARLIMRYAGPRMLLRHPILAISHQLDNLRKARHPRELSREQRLQSRKH